MTTEQEPNSANQSAEIEMLREKVDVAIEFFELMKTITCKHAMRRTVAKALFRIQLVEDEHRKKSVDSSV